MGDAIFRAGKAEALKFAGHLGASVAVGATIGADGVHVGEELRVGRFVAARGTCGRSVIAAAGDSECLAKFADGKGAPRGVNQPIPPGDVSLSQLDQAIAKTARNPSGIAPYAESVSDPPTQAEMQDFAAYVETLRAALVRQVGQALQRLLRAGPKWACCWWGLLRL